MNHFSHVGSHLMMGHSFGGSIGGSLFHSMVSSVGWHIVGSLFRGQSFVGSLCIGVVVIVLLMLVRRAFSR
jgi:hypothetical protein